TVGGGPDTIAASATVNGGIYTHGPDPNNPFQLTATLCDDAQIANDGDPNKLRFRDLNGFDLLGDLRAGIFAELTIGVKPFKKTFVFPFAETVLIDLNHPCTPNAPVLANDPGPDGKFQSNQSGSPITLRLNMGPNANTRNFHPEIIDEMFTVMHVDGMAGDETVDVTAFGATQRYYHIKDIFADGGSGNDTVILQRSSAKKMGVLSQATLLGGTGDDNLSAGEGP